MPVRASSHTVTSKRMSITPRGCLRSKAVAMFMTISSSTGVGKDCPYPRQRTKVLGSGTSCHVPSPCVVKPAATSARSRGCGHRRAVPAGHPDSDARRARRRSGRTGCQMPAGTAGSRPEVAPASPMTSTASNAAPTAPSASCVTDTEPTWPRNWCARRAIGEPSEVGAVLGSGSPLGSTGQPGRRVPVVIACREREQ